MRNNDIDFGTPAVLNGSPDVKPNGASSEKVSLTVDGHPVEVPAGTSIMRAAVEAGIPIPKLCATDSLQAFGSCRLCLIEIEGRRGLHASCTEPAREGMAVRTQNEHIAKIRRGVMELYISDHPLDCLTCPANGDCELEDMAGAIDHGYYLKRSTNGQADSTSEFMFAAMRQVPVMRTSTPLGVELPPVPGGPAQGRSSPASASSGPQCPN